MSDPETLVRRFWRQVFDERDLAAVPGLVTLGFAWRGSLGRHTSGVPEFVDYAAAAQQAMPDLTVELAEVVTSQSQVWARLTFQATHRGTLLGVEATNRPVSYVGMGVFDVADGRLSRAWVVADTLSLREQLIAG